MKTRAGHSGIVVRHHRRRVFGQAIQNVVRIRALLAMVENVADSEPLQFPARVAYAVQNELVETITGVGIIEGQSFIEEHGKAGLVRQFHGVRQSMIPSRAAIYLRPVKNVLRAIAEGRGIQQLDPGIGILDNEVCCHEGG